MATPDDDFARYCCELLASVGPCRLKRMFGGYGLSTGGLTVAWVVDLGQGEKLWLKADEDTRARYEAAGCERFTYLAKGVERSVNYYSAPEEAMESPALMAPWARQALECALKAAARANRPRATKGSSASTAKPRAKRAAAPAASPKAPRKSAKG